MLVCVRVRACVRVRPSVSWCVRVRGVALEAAEASFRSFEGANRRSWHNFAPWELKFYLYRVFSPRTPRTHYFFILFLAVHSLIIGCFFYRGICPGTVFRDRSPE